MTDPTLDLELQVLEHLGVEDGLAVTAFLTRAAELAVLRRHLEADVQRAGPELVELVAEHLPGADGAEVLEAFDAYVAAELDRLGMRRLIRQRGLVR